MSTALQLAPSAALAQRAALPPHLATLPAPLLPVATAYVANQDPCRAYTVDELAPDLQAALSGAAVNLGLTKTDLTGADLLLRANQTAQLVIEAFGTMKPAEIVEAIGRGSRGAYSLPLRPDGQLPYEPFAIPTLRRWITCYRDAERWEVVKAAQAEDNRRQAEADAANARDLTTDEWLGYAFQVLRSGTLGAECHYMAVPVYDALKEWQVLNGFCPPGWKTPKEWYLHVEKVAAGQLRLELRAEIDGGLRHGGQITKLTDLLHDREVLFDKDTASRLKVKCKRAIVGAYATHVADLSDEGLRGLLAEAAAAHSPQTA